jgi:sugar lactone lactonase YvrE
VTPIRIISAQNIVGEGILWNGRRGQLWWTDIQSSQLHRLDWASGRLEVYGTPERVGSFGFVAGSERLVTAFASGVALFDVAGKTLEWIARPAEIVAGVRFNDGRVDRRGRFWAGTMVEGPQRTADGCLYSIGPRGSLRRHERGIRISNGLCMSPDGARLYFADSPLRTIFVYDLAEPEGLLTNRRVFARTPAGASPDGAAVDVDGCVWSAHWGASCIVRYTPEGRIDQTIPVPTSQPSCVCFGGPKLDILCVTSARENLDAPTLSAEPHAGSVFLYQTAAQGLPEPEYLQ